MTAWKIKLCRDSCNLILPLIFLSLSFSVPFWSTFSYPDLSHVKYRNHLINSWSSKPLRYQIGLVGMQCLTSGFCQTFIDSNSISSNQAYYSIRRLPNINNSCYKLSHYKFYLVLDFLFWLDSNTTASPFLVLHHAISEM